MKLSSIAVLAITSLVALAAEQNLRTSRTKALDDLSLLLADENFPDDFEDSLDEREAILSGAFEGLHGFGEIYEEGRDDESAPTKKRNLRKKNKKKEKKKGSESASKGVMIKLYWQKGYKWQGKKYESKYCMEKDKNKIEIQKCSSSERDQRWGVVGKTIRTANGNECMTKTGRIDIGLKRCDGSKDQQWDGFRRNGRFELHPVGRRGDVCVTQHHHPKKGENIKVQICSTARRHDTSYWNVH